ncbi:hypothetical protein Naga_100302g1 [Nannochloropsis gaditana]|uniref:Uncharacterized protein n=1 Tax=Nannochloropsis gaditana TaxID=72520 RepID=W7TE30_9STRA|nr:hypothetical protein Naga_100302g1 [Nannochloropsis gaditana]
MNIYFFQWHFQRRSLAPTTVVWATKRVGWFKPLERKVSHLSSSSTCSPCLSCFSHPRGKQAHRKTRRQFDSREHACRGVDNIFQAYRDGLLQFYLAACQAPEYLKLNSDVPCILARSTSGGSFLSPVVSHRGHTLHADLPLRPFFPLPFFHHPCGEALVACAERLRAILSQGGRICERGSQWKRRGRSAERGQGRRPSRQPAAATAPKRRRGWRGWGGRRRLWRTWRWGPCGLERAAADVYHRVDGARSPIILRARREGNILAGVCDSGPGVRGGGAHHCQQPERG